MGKRAEKTAVINVIIVVLAVVVAMLCRYYDKYDRTDTLSIIRSAIYILLFSWWGITLRNRVVQIQAKRFMTAIAVLIVFWVVIRTVKFIYADDPFFIRMLWYMYYIPMIFIPFFALQVSLSLGKPENYRLPRIISVLYIISALLVITVLTNDYHCLVFRFPDGIKERSDRAYSYSFMYYIVAGYMLVCAAVTLIVLISKCRIPKTGKMLVLPILPIVAMIAYSVLYVSGAITKGTLLHTLAGDMTITVSLLTALAVECCIQCGLIRSNTHYIELLRPCTLPAVITDDDYNVLLSSDCAETLSKQTMRSAGDFPVMKGKKRLSSSKIRCGHVFWLDDLSELIEVNERLSEIKDDLKDEYDLLCEEYDLKNREAHILERDRIYDRIQHDTAVQIRILDRLTDEFDSSEDEDERRKLLGKMLIIGAYLKRRNNLIFLSDKSEQIDEKELYLAFRELTDNLELYGVVCGSDIRIDTPVPSDVTMEMYDTFERIIELSLDNITAVNVIIGKSDNSFIMTGTADSKCSLAEMSGGNITAVCDDDGEWQIRYVSGVAKCTE